MAEPPALCRTQIKTTLLVSLAWMVFNMMPGMLLFLYAIGIRRSVLKNACRRVSHQLVEAPFDSERSLHASVLTSGMLHAQRGVGFVTAVFAPQARRASACRAKLCSQVCWLQLPTYSLLYMRQDMRTSLLW